MAAYAAACHGGTDELQPSLFDCGNLIIDLSTGTPTRPKHTEGIQQQLPKGVFIGDGCWSVAPDGRLEGYFERETTAATYVSELKSDRWILMDTQAWGVVRNPYVLHDNVH